MADKDGGDGDGDDGGGGRISLPVVRRLVMGDTGNSNGRMDTKSGDIDENTMGLPLKIPLKLQVRMPLLLPLPLPREKNSRAKANRQISALLHHGSKMLKFVDNSSMGDDSSMFQVHSTSSVKDTTSGELSAPCTSSPATRTHALFKHEYCDVGDQSRCSTIVNANVNTKQSMLLDNGDEFKESKCNSLAGTGARMYGSYKNGSKFLKIKLYDFGIYVDREKATQNVSKYINNCKNEDNQKQGTKSRSRRRRRPFRTIGSFAARLNPLRKLRRSRQRSHSDVTDAIFANIAESGNERKQFKEHSQHPPRQNVYKALRTEEVLNHINHDSVPITVVYKFARDLPVERGDAGFDLT